MAATPIPPVQLEGCCLRRQSSGFQPHPAPDNADVALVNTGTPVTCIARVIQGRVRLQEAPRLRLWLLPGRPIDLDGARSPGPSGSWLYLGIRNVDVPRPGQWPCRGAW